MDRFFFSVRECNFVVVLVYPTLLAVVPRYFLVVIPPRETVLIPSLESVEAWKGSIKILGCNFFVGAAVEPGEISGVTEDGLVKESSIDSLMSDGKVSILECVRDLEGFVFCEIPSFVAAHSQDGFLVV